MLYLARLPAGANDLLNPVNPVKHFSVSGEPVEPFQFSSRKAGWINYALVQSGKQAFTEIDILDESSRYRSEKRK